jgi:uncharacterized membrane protein
LSRRVVNHTRHHGRFYLALLLGIAAWAAGLRLVPSVRLALAGDVFFGSYLAGTAWFALSHSPAQLRRRAAVADEGIAVIVLLVGLAVGFSIAAILMLLEQHHQPNPLLVAATLAGVPLGWLTVHTIAGFHYARLYYVDADARPGQQDRGGIEFPQTPEPAMWDFLYFAFTIGMTAQVSDTAVTSTLMRRTVLAHAVASFFFNTVLVAMAVNVIVTMTS